MEISGSHSGNVAPAVNTTLALDYFLHKSCLLAMGQQCTGKYSCVMLAQIVPDKVLDYFPVQTCLWAAVGQHCTGNFIVQCWPSQIKTTFYSLFSHEKMTVGFESTLHK